LTYPVQQVLEAFPDTARFWEGMFRDNVNDLEKQLELSDGAHEVLRELGQITVCLPRFC
jgi:hypothetical protein